MASDDRRFFDIFCGSAAMASGVAASYFIAPHHSLGGTIAFGVVLGGFVTIGVFLALTIRWGNDSN